MATAEKMNSYYWSTRHRCRISGDGRTVLRRRLLRDLSCILMALFLFAIFHVWTRIEVVSTGYEIRKLTQEQEALKGESHGLRVEVATLRSPIRLEKVARQLGLKRAPEKQVLLLTSRSP